MRRTIKGTICITLAIAGLLSPNARAAHATNFLDDLQSEVTNRLANPEPESTRAELRALANAARALNRNTRTLSADLGALASAAAQLNARFPDDATLAELEADAIADYSSDAHARLDDIDLWIGTNDVSRGLSNQVARAAAALARADATTDNVPAQARALASVFNRLLPLQKKVRQLFEEPSPLPVPPVVINPPSINLPPAVAPGTPGLAPDSVGTHNVDLSENAPVNEQTKFYFSTATSGAQVYNVHYPEELGLWTYVRTGANTAVIAVFPNYPGNASPRLLNLTFTSATGGTFTGTTYFGEALEGTFAIIQ